MDFFYLGFSELHVKYSRYGGIFFDSLVLFWASVDKEKHLW